MGAKFQIGDQTGLIEDDQALSVRSLIRGKKITNILLLYISIGTKYSRNRVEIG